MTNKSILAVLDASAIYAVIKGEPGGLDVNKILDQSVATTYNIAEVVNKMVLRKQATHAESWLLLESLIPNTYPVDMELSEIATGFSQIIDSSFGISLGDKLCLALGKHLNKTIYTADHAWKQFETKLNLKIKLIR
jgi:PIN domain nuclease of toxin-antitoxin system